MSNNDSAPKADGLKYSEERLVPELTSGARPRSIRKRGYHRALKRGELWAVHDKAARSLMQDTVFDLIYKNNPLLAFSKTPELSQKKIEFIIGEDTEDGKKE